MYPRVVITGMGVVSALGVGVEANAYALKHGVSGIGAARYLPTDHLEFPIGEVPMDND